MNSKCFPVAAGLFAFALYFCEPSVQAVNVLTQHNDNSRTGANTSETVLTTSNVKTGSFGPIFTNRVDGNVYAQPLYVQGMTISGGTHNVVFIATENNTVYAFDADSGSTYWTNHLVGSLSSGCGDTSPLVGITGTPVIDLTLGALYVDTRLGSTAGHELHAVNITNGTEMFGGPVTVSATGFGTSQHQRPGLLEVSNVIYVAYGSQCDAGTYHGFVISFSATNLAQLHSWNDTPNGSMAAIWGSGMGPVADASGNIYVITANGSYDGSTNNDYGESMVKLSSTLSLLDWATPSDYATLTGNDEDFGSGGAVLLPGGHLIGEGKDGIVHVANTSSMGHLNGFAQSFAGPNGGDVVGPSPVYWQGSGTNFIYYEHGNTSTYWYSYNGTTVNTTPLGSNTFSEADTGGGISLSANGTNNGILWSSDSDSNLRAYDAAHFPTLLWSGSVGTFQKETCPTIANGKVYVGTSSTLVVFGLNNSPPAITSQPSSTTKNVGQTATFTVSASGSSPLHYQWRVESGGAYGNISAGGQFSGVTNTTLSISSLVLTNATNYDVVVTNSYGSVTSAAATLTVLTNSSTNSYQTVILADHPAAYWPMQETSGPTIQDIVSTNNGTLMTSTDGTSLGLNDHTNFATAGSGSTDGATYLLGGAGGLTGVSGDKAIYFTNLNGSVNNSQIVVPYNAVLDPASTFSAEAWIKLPTYPIGYTNNNYQTALGLEANGGAQNGWFMAVLVDNSGAPGDFYFNLARPPGSGWTSPTTTTSVGGTWVYAVEVCTGGTNLTCYTNGVQMSTVSWTTNNYESEGVYGLHKLPFIIGSYCASYNTGTNILTGFERGNFWDGAVSHVAIYTNALSASQITNHYYFATNPAAGPPPSYESTILADNPTAFWQLNETSGTVIHDVAGTNNGTVMNPSGVTLGGQGVNYSHNTNSKAIYFINTNSGYISVPYNAAFQTANFSAELWLNMPTFPANAQSANENPVSFCDGDSPTGWTFDIQVANAANPSMYGWCAKNSSSWNSANSGTALQSQWSYYAMTFNGSTLTVYTNGVSAVSTSVTTYNTASNGTPLFIGDYDDLGAVGGEDTNRYYQGGMSEVAVYNYALTSSQVANHYKAGTNYSSGGGAEYRAPLEPAFKPTIGTTLTPTLLTKSPGKQFQMQVTAVPNQNYTLQMSTDLTSPDWISLYTTNSTTNTTFVLTDPNAATNKQRFYRVLIGP